MRCPLFLLLLIAATPAPAQDQPGPFASFDLAGPAVLNDPHDLTIGPDGRLYVADKFAARIAVLDPETLELVDEIALGRLPGVHDISFDADGRAVIAVTGTGAVLLFDDLTGKDPQPVQAFAAPRVEGALLHSNGLIYAMASGIGALIAYDSERVVAVAEGHYGAHDVAEDPQGNIWVADNFARRLVKYSPELARLQVIDHLKFGFVGPRYLDFDAFGRLAVADQEDHRILLINPDGPDGGTLLGVLGTGLPGAGPGLLDDPEGIASDGARYFISDSDNNRVVRYTVVVN
jgi:hypothetical protein